LYRWEAWPGVDSGAEVAKRLPRIRIGKGCREVTVAGGSFRHNDLGIRHVACLVGDGGAHPNGIGRTGIPSLGAE
jgi:hypothetical protein